MRPVFALTYLVIFAVNLALAVPAQNGPPNVDTRSIADHREAHEAGTRITVRNVRGTGPDWRRD